MDNVVTAAVSSIESHTLLILYQKGIKSTLTYICEIKEVFLDIPPYILSPSSSARQTPGDKHPYLQLMNDATASGNLA